jgi:PHD/YefM family antitoxin component YafN of YafNO toxin-antitoxin module
MDEISATVNEIRKNIDYWIEKAQNNSVVIKDKDEPQAVLVSVKEYKRFTRGDRKVIRASELTKEEIKSIEAENVPEEAKLYDHEIDGWKE